MRKILNPFQVIIHNSSFLISLCTWYFILGTLISILCASHSKATSYTWNGSSSTAWATAANWTPNAVPTSADNVTIVTATNAPQLATDVTVTNFTLTSGSLNLNGYNITVNGNGTFTAGTLSGGSTDTLYLTAGTATFTGGTLNPYIHAVVATLKFNGSTFNGKGYFEANTNVPGTGNGGSTFNDTISIVRSYSGSGNMNLANVTAGNIYNKPVTFINNGTGAMNITTYGASKFNDNILVECNNTGGINFGSASTSDTLASGKTITIGSGGFTSGTLVLRNFIQLGSTAQTLTATSSATINCINAVFNGNVTFTAPSFLTKATTYNGTFASTQNGSSNVNWSGYNVFNSTATITNSSASAYLRVDFDSADTFYGNVTLTNSSTGGIRFCHSNTTSLYGNLTSNSIYNLFNSGSGTLAFRGGNDQTFYSPNAIIENVLMKKSAGTVALDTSATITGVFTFDKGIMVTTSDHLLSFNATSSVTGASDSSFIGGPVKKIGNSAFVFPVGRGLDYRALEISAPSSSTDAFTAEYFSDSQTIGDSVDNVLSSVSYCNYWSFNRNNGTSNVYVSLKWDSAYCATFDTTYMRLAFWDGYKWIDKGHGSFSGNSYIGKMTSNTTVTNYGYITLGTTAATPGCSSPNYTWNNVSTTSIGSTFTTPFGTTLLIQGTLTVDNTFSLSQCNNILMDAGARILINPSCTLSINISNISACPGTRWKHIKISDNTARLNVVRSNLADADTAIWANSGGVYSVVSSSINRCWKGIAVGAYGSPQTSTITRSWIGCALPARSTNTTTIPVGPFAGLRSSRGIEVNSATSITIGTGANNTSDNTFFNMDIGISNISTTLNVVNSNFEKMDVAGRGILSNISSGTHSVTVNSCNFKTCYKGTDLTNATTTVTYNLFEYVSYPVEIRAAAKTINVEHNQFNYFTRGVNVFRSPGATITVDYNNFNTLGTGWLPVNLSYYGQHAIMVTNAALQTTNVFIGSNYMSNTITGILLQNINNTTINNFTVADNFYFAQIAYGSFLDNNPHYAIVAKHCYYNQVSVNSIVRAASGTTIDGREHLRIFGFQGSLYYNSIVTRNIINHISSGINFRDVCSGSRIQCNLPTECFRGVDLGYVSASGVGPSVTMNDQGAPAWANCWASNASNLASEQRVFGRANPPIRWWYVGGAVEANCLYPYNVATSAFGSVVEVNTALSITCPAFPLSFEREYLLSSIVRDTLTYTDFAYERRYMQLEYAFRMLDEDTAERLHIDEDDSVYIAFYNRYVNTNIGKYRRVQKLLDAANYEDAADSLATITDTNKIEDNRKTVLDIYLDKIIREEELSTDDSSALESIADECPIIGGGAVYEARAILQIEKVDSCMEEEGRMMAPWHPGNKKRGYEYLSVYPNPAKDFINIRYKFNDANAVLQIADVSGKEVKSVKLASSANSYNVDIENLTSGMYFYSVKTLNGNRKTGKFVKH